MPMTLKQREQLTFLATIAGSVASVVAALAVMGAAIYYVLSLEGKIIAVERRLDVIKTQVDALTVSPCAGLVMDWRQAIPT